MKNIRFWAYFSAFLSLVISLAIVGYWICSVHELKVVNLNTFVGVTVALLGMIVTLAIAWQIYNAVDMKSKIEELKQLENKIKEQEESFKKFNLEATRDMSSLAWGLMMEHKDLLKAFCFYFASLEASIQLDDSDFDFNMDVLEKMIKEMEDIKDIDTKDVDDIKEIDKRIRTFSNYKHIKRRYEPLFNELISKLEKKEE